MKSENLIGALHLPWHFFSYLIAPYYYYWDSFSHRLNSLSLSCFVAVLQNNTVLPEMPTSLLLTNTHTYLIFLSFRLHSTVFPSAVYSRFLHTLCLSIAMFHYLPSSMCSSIMLVSSMYIIFRSSFKSKFSDSFS